MNIEDGINRRFIMVQLPEPLEEDSEAFKAGYRNLSELAKERLRRVRSQIVGHGKERITDLGFRVFELSTSNIRAWTPDGSNLEESLLFHQENLVEGRSEQDVLYELLLKRGVDLAVPIDSREVNGKIIYCIGYGMSFVCLDEFIPMNLVEDIGQGIVNWYLELAPNADTHVFFRDSAFSDDISKINMVAILEQNGINHIRSL